MEDEISYMQTHPPRCLENKVTTPIDTLQDFLRGQLGDNSTSFSPECECGSYKFTMAKPIEYSFGVTSITCCDCGKTRTLFDPSKYGFDGELGHNANLELGLFSRICG
jgi:hypothetical protein